MSLQIRGLRPAPGHRMRFLLSPLTHVLLQPTCPRGTSVRTINRVCKTRIASPHEHEDFFRYTSGRWLWDEQQQLRDRYQVFNVAELQNVATKAMGSHSCVSMTKLAEGGFNKVFRLIMNDGRTILARIRNPNAGPPFYTTASEVATMDFVRTILQIPGPRIVEWSATTDNSVGSEYIIMEEATGTQLSKIWDKTSPETKLEIMSEVVSVETKLLSISFSHYGNIYFASDAVAGAVPAQVTNDIPVQLKDQVSKKFTIGPAVDRGFWNKERSTMDIARGPWSNLEDYASCLGSREMAWIERYAVPKPPDDPLLASSAQNDPQAHLRLLEKYTQIVPHIVNIDSILTRPTLWHPDLHTSNLFVDNGHITAIIDWQDTWTGPLFLQAQASAVVNYQGSILLERPNNFDDLDVEQQAQIKEKISKSILLQLYLMETKDRNPILARAFHFYHGKTRRLPLELAGNTWDDDIVSFREALINVERYWNELGIQGDCPIHFTHDELKSHLIDAEEWNEVQDFFDSIEGLVKRDGWTHHETFDAALDFFRNLRSLGLKDMAGEERETFEKQTRWIKDHG